MSHHLFTHGLAQEVSSGQTFVTRRACFFTEPMEVSRQTGSATAHAFRDAIFVQSTRDVPMLSIFHLHLQWSHLFQQVSSPQFVFFHDFGVFLFLILSLQSFNSVSIRHRPSPFMWGFAISAFPGCSLSLLQPLRHAFYNFPFAPLQNLQLWEDPQTSSRRPLPSRDPSFLRPLPTSLSVSKLEICPVCLSLLSAAPILQVSVCFGIRVGSCSQSRRPVGVFSRPP